MNKKSNALSPGTLINSPQRSYTVVRILGQGGFGITYLVSSNIIVDNIAIEARFALKEHFISSLCSRDEDSRSVQYSAPVAAEVNRSLLAFTKEAMRLKSLGITHPNIVRINEVFEANNTAYYVMEYLGSTTLADYVDTHGPMALSAARHLLRPVAEAVAMLHHNGIAHYDIKPANIMLHQTKSGNLRPVLIDFGLAKHYNDNGHATSTLAVAGYSPGYSPAEQYAGLSEFMPRCDIYSLAATYFFCITGHAPKDALKLRATDVETELLPIIGSEETPPVVRALSMVPETRTPDVETLINEMFDGKVPHQSASTAKNEDATLPIDSVKPARVLPVTGIIAAAITIISIVAGFLIFSRDNTTEPPVKNVTENVATIKPSRPEKAEGNTRQQQQSPSKPTIQENKVEPQPTTNASTVSPTQTSTDIPGRLTPANLDLCTVSDGRRYYFNRAEWRELSSDKQKNYRKTGIVVMGNGKRFILSLHHHGPMTWDDAITTYGRGSLPTKAQAEVMAGMANAINLSIRAFGGDSDPQWWYWTGEEDDDSYVWVVNMKDGFTNSYNKTSSYRVRTVSSL